ncbi:T9SS type B sorting domain-containing protein [Zobellia barbeyronii]|uniref:T9SS type B sorting domain-containing protein n=1 Tax=Zobellia barbeyronii TaxID=2748009 RepID=A0ABS5WD06_9FLAO|nr:T9SS type B sorting domain-containing protein [Zobellia barbeyronii]MBT2161299.1 T9SS type B sorting domain-containing protein [Zobellia barbeyronii]
MKKFFTFLFIIFFNILSSQCPLGSVILITQNDVNNFVSNYPTCTTIDGNLEIRGSDINDISGLSSLRVINGELKIIGTQVVDFTGLSFLTEIRNGHTEIRENHSLISVNLENLMVLNSYMSINVNNNLLTISGFTNFTEMQSIEISNNYSLTSIPLFNNLNKIETLSITENESLVNFDGFDNLRCVGYFIIHGNDILETIPKFNNLKRVSGFSFRISFNPYLKSVEGFQSLEFVNNLLIIESNGWRNDSMPISNFPELKEITGPLMLVTGISEINGFNKLVKVGSIKIDGTKATEIVGFESLREVTSIDIDNHLFYLERIDAFKNVVFIQNDFRFYNNRVLNHINGFQKLKTVGGDFNFNNQYEITNLDFLESLTSVGYVGCCSRLTLTGNTSLNDCRAIALLMKFGELPGRIDVYGNGVNCSSQPEIIDNADQDRDGVLDSVDQDDDNDGIYDSIENAGDNDIDGDLIPNSLDLNSDNDGCNDVIEAGLDDDNNDGIVGGEIVTVDDNGLVTSSTMAYSAPNDLNGDSVLDFLDFNSSPVVSEQPIPQSVIAGNDVTFSTVITNADTFQWEMSNDLGVTWEDLPESTVFSGVNINSLTINSASIAYNEAHFRLRFYNSTSTCVQPIYSAIASLEVTNTSLNPGMDSSTFSCPNDAPFNLFNAIDGSPDPGGYWVPALGSGGDIFDPSTDSPGVYRYYLESDNCVYVFSEMTVDVENNNAGTDSKLNICVTSSAVELFLSLEGSPDTLGTWTPSLSSGTGMFDPTVDNAGIYTYTVGNTTCGSVSAQVDVTIVEEPSAGTDGFISLCSNDLPFDLFSGLTGNPDSGGTWSPTLSSGTGIFNPTIDSAGIYTYTVSNGICQDSSAILEVLINTPPDAGEDIEINVCLTDSPFNLLESLGGTPENGGEWTPSLSSNDDIFDPLLDTADVYTYSITSNTCPDSSATIIVNIFDEANPGIDNGISICENDPPINLFTLLGGNPETEGVWFPALSSGTGVFDPRLDSEGIFTYTVNNPGCGNQYAIIEVDVLEIPNAGEDSSVNICVNEGLVDLFDFIPGNPDPNGIWTPSLVSGNSTFDPAIDTEGSYIYTVTNAVCGEDSSNLEVSILEVYPISNYELKTTDWNGNNEVYIEIESERTYEYSLDGINYQSNNTFSGLLGGFHKIFAREINGCGILKAEFSIIDYPRFFTPNSNLVNDKWHLVGLENEEYTLDIYDRYGKLLKQLSNVNHTWDGLYNGQQLPATDYWFKVKFTKGQTLTGHFSLKY